MSAFGVLCGMTLPMLCLPTAFIGALGLVPCQAWLKAPPWGSGVWCSTG